MAMTESHPVDFKVRDNRYVIIAICHGVKLSISKIWGKFYGSFCRDLDKHQLVNHVFSKEGKVCDIRCNFCKIAGHNRTLDAETIRFNENVFLLEPAKKMTVVALKLDVAECTVAQHVASNANMCLVVFFIASSGHFKELLKFGFSRWD